MHIHTYGSPSAPVMILLHPPGLSGQQFYQLVQPHLKGDYRIISPDLGGHGDDPGDYISPANDGKTLLRYLKEKGIRKIRLLFGASVGAAAALRLLEDPELQFDRIHLDSVPLISRSSVKQSLVTSVVQKEMKKHRKEPETLKSEIRDLEKSYGPELPPLLTESFMKYSEKSLKNLCAAFFSNSSIRGLPRELQEKMTMEWGANDNVYKESGRNIKKNYPYARIVVREGEGHCGFLAKNTEAVITEIEKSLNGES